MRFTKNTIYKSKTHGLVKFMGLDVYMGQTTFHFQSLTYSEHCYWLPDSIEDYIDLEDAMKVAVLIKAALDAAVLLDDIKDRLESNCVADAAARIAERIHTAVEALQPPVEIPA